MMNDTSTSNETFTAKFSTAFTDGREIISGIDDAFTSETFIDRIYNVYFSLLAGQFRSLNSEYVNRYMGKILTCGFYFPAVGRCYLTGQIDLINDFIPEYAAVAIPGENPTFIVVTKENFPRGILRPCPGTEVRTGWLLKDGFGERCSVSSRSDSLDIVDRYVVVKANGHLTPAIYRNDLFANQVSFNAAATHSASYALNIWNDRRYLWQVQTSELLYAAPTPIIAGVAEEHIKSLFYARSLPVTPTGRKRPILHWVQAHQRRLKVGIDVDVTKHLRGTESFEMGGFAFSINNPCKPTLPRRR